ncbi:MAG: hypothetical protein WBG92_23405, partial [Thiohalocapsa sp.]
MLARIVLSFALVTVIAAVLSYYHVLEGLRSQGLEQLEKYVAERGVRESERFLLAADNLQVFAKTYANALETMGGRD